MRFLLNLLPLLGKVPIQYKALAGIGVALVLLSGAFGAGWKVAGWKAGSERATLVEQQAQQVLTLTQERIDAVAAKDRYIGQLEAAIEANNRDLAVAAAQTEAAKAARAQAEIHAAELATFSKSRMDRLQAAFDNAMDCSQVLAEYWELRR